MTLTPAEAAEQSRFLKKVLHQQRLQMPRPRSAIARVLDIDESTLVRWEMDDNAHPKLDDLIAWANAVGMECRIQMTPNGTGKKE